MDEELDRFKRCDWRHYAASIGYGLDKRESSRNSTVMRKNHDKIIISRKPDGVFTYWSPRDDDDRGTVIDFVQRRKGLTLGGVRKELRAWMNMPPTALPYLPELSKTTKDRAAVQRRYALMRIAHHHPYLEQVRGIPALALQYWRFAGRIKADRYSNAVFPHHDTEGLCGYELKNRNFTGFASGGSKGLWLSKTCPEDRRLVICESSIDALSHAVLFPDGHARYASIGGKLNPVQPQLIQAQIKLMPEGSEIVAAMDSDAPGRELAEAVRKAFNASGRPDLRFRQDEPSGAKDWNDLLRKKQSMRPLLYRPEVPSVA
jgi:hypothetical protein